ncbi:MAG: recombinase family protein [Butyricicoccus sp.]|nr:recombinase family protein [Butyricicoccus sp.]
MSTYERLVNSQNFFSPYLTQEDLSRLGRNSARTSDLLDEYFPAHHVRFISITDGYDSACPTSAIAMATPLMTAMHEMYARDISNKIRSSFHTKIRNGEFIGSFAPFGYQKDPLNHNRLLPDPQAAAVVRLLFSYACQGDTPAQIAQKLNAQHLLPPLAYRIEQTPLASTLKHSCWSASSVRKILKNPVYCGHTLQGKSHKLSFKNSRMIPVPRSEWVLVLDTHLPLIDRVTWECVQQNLSHRKPVSSAKFQNIFSGIAKCADCGRNMSTVGTRRKGSAAALACGGYKQHGKTCCTNHHIAYEDLYAAVLSGLQTAFALSEADEQHLLTELHQQAPAPAEWQDEEAQTIRKKLTRLYDDKYADRISPELFSELLQRYQFQLEYLNSHSPIYTAKPDNGSTVERELQNILHPTTLDAQIVQTFIRRIVVHQKQPHDKSGQTQTIEIWFRFSCPSQQIHI